jgi:hypothetical protein
MRLIYVSPVPWASFEQRPHKFVRWFHASRGAEVLWFDPYPTRLPTPADLARLRHGTLPPAPPVPAWLHVVRPRALPIEPLPVSGWVNRLLWADALARARAFAAGGPTLLVLGKPALFALQLVHALERCGTLYDAMDDFPAFYRGLSRWAMRCRERRLARRVDALWASSSALQQHWHGVRGDAQRVLNGLDAALLPTPRERRADAAPRVFGYVGTMAAWFDWSAIDALARARPLDRVRLIGPRFEPPPPGLPANVELLPPCDHAQALRAMNAFDVGLIPFKRNALTAGVDPIKYYEYRALGLPVLSSAFGEMQRRGDEAGVFLYDECPDGIASSVAAAARAACGVARTAEPEAGYAGRHAWSARFDAAWLPAPARERQRERR